MINRSKYIDDYGLQLDPLFDMVDQKDERIAKLEAERDDLERKGKLLCNQNGHLLIQKHDLESQLEAVGCERVPGNILFWWGCVEANAELSGEPIRNKDVILHLCANGATAMVYAEDMRNLVNPTGKPKSTLDIIEDLLPPQDGAG